MNAHYLNRRAGALSWGIVLAGLVAGSSGCKPLTGPEPDAAPKWSDTLGQGLRGLPERKPDADQAAGQKPESGPFWEKWRDKRVDQINRNLSVEEPPGW